MKIAIFGANSQIAKDLILLFARSEEHQLVLFARRPDVLAQWLSHQGVKKDFITADYSSFNNDQLFDAIINCVGIGDPIKARLIGADIFDVTQKYDEYCISYLKHHISCRYIFLSSGAAYGSIFEKEVAEHTVAKIPINALKAQDWYGVAKLYAECRHRALSFLPIIDVRVFNYISRNQDLGARFFITDVIRAIQKKTALEITPNDMVRDYIGPEEVHHLISGILNSPASNEVVDCYSKSPVSKFALLSSLEEKFGLEYSVTSCNIAIDSTGLKSKYYSLNRRAEKFGYLPKLDSLQIVIRELNAIFSSD